MWYRQHLFEYVSYPAMTSRAVVLVLRVQFLEELCDVHDGAVREVLGLVPVRGVVTTHVAHNQVIEGFEVAALELHGFMVASDPGGPSGLSGDPRLRAARRMGAFIDHGPAGHAESLQRRASGSESCQLGTPSRHQCV